MAKDINVKITGDSRDLERALRSASSGASKFGRAVVKGGLALTAGLGVGAAFAVKASSDLEESMNAVQVVFGKATKSINKFGEDSARSVGLSQRAFNQAVTPIGAALQNVGFGAQEAANQSINLTKRASDMASVFNTDVATALEAIQAGLRGEADPLERFGVGLSDAAVQAQAAKMGMQKLDGQFTAGQKARARVALFFEQTAKFAGDFNNTSGSLANRQKILRARLEDLAASLGDRLVPFLVTAAEKAEKVFDFLDKVGRQKSIEAKVRVVLEGIADTARSFWDAVFGPQFEKKLVEFRPGKTKKLMVPTDSLARQFTDAFVDAIEAVDWIEVGDSIRKGLTGAFKDAADKWDPTKDTAAKREKVHGWIKREVLDPITDAFSDEKNFTSLAEMLGIGTDEAQAATSSQIRDFRRLEETGRKALGNVRLRLDEMSTSGLKAKDRIEALGASGSRAAPKLGAAARTAQALADAWNRVIDLPSAKAFEIRFRSITTVEENRLQGVTGSSSGTSGPGARNTRRGADVVNLHVDGQRMASAVRLADGRWAMQNG